MYIEFLTGTLPWKGKSKDIIGQLKQELTNQSLFSGLPAPLLKIYEHLKSLGYPDKPDYDLIVGAFDEILKEIRLGALLSKRLFDDAMSCDTNFGAKDEEEEEEDDDEDDAEGDNQEDTEEPPLMTSPQAERSKRTVYASLSTHQELNAATLIENYPPVSIANPVAPSALMSDPQQQQQLHMDPMSGANTNNDSSNGGSPKHSTCFKRSLAFAQKFIPR